MKKETRRSPRFEIKLVVDISLRRETFFSARGVDLSEGGLRLITRYPLEPQSKLFIMFTLDGRQESMIRAEALVVHAERNSEGYSCGIAFSRIPSGDHEKLKAALRKLA